MFYLSIEEGVVQVSNLHGKEVYANIANIDEWNAWAATLEAGALSDAMASSSIDHAEEYTTSPEVYDLTLALNGVSGAARVVFVQEFVESLKVTT